MKILKSKIILLILLVLSNIFSACGLKGPPRPPEEPLPQKPSRERVSLREGCVDLSWRAPKPDPDHLASASWEVLRAPAPGPGEEPIYRVIATAETTHYSDCSIEPGAAAWYIVRPLAPDGTRGPATKPVTVVNPAPPPAPLSLTAEPGDGYVDLAWQPIPAPEKFTIGYNLYRSQDLNNFLGRPLNGEPLTEPSFTDGPLDNNTVFFYQVRAVLLIKDAVPAEGPATPAISSTPRDLTPPAAPAGLTASYGPAGVNLRWLRNQESDIKGYIVYRRPRGQASFTALTPEAIAETSYLDSRAAAGSEYEYAIRAVDTATPPNLSPFSDLQVVYLPP